MKPGKVWLLHVVAGAPAAALAHSLVQMAYAWESPRDVVLLLPHFLLGLVAGLPILALAYSLQAGLFFLLARGGVPLMAQVVAGAAVQAGVVGLWSATIGVQPSLEGNFPMPPVMIAAAAVVGGLVAAFVYRKASREGG